MIFEDLKSYENKYKCDKYGFINSITCTNLTQPNCYEKKDLNCSKCGTKLRYNAELTHDPTFQKEGLRWLYCSKCDVNFSGGK